MTSEAVQQVLSDVFGGAAGAVETVAQTDRGVVWAFAVRGTAAEALSVWRKAREALVEHALWPLLCGSHALPGLLDKSEENVRAFAEACAVNAGSRQGHSSRAVVAQGLALDLDGWVKRGAE